MTWALWGQGGCASAEASRVPLHRWAGPHQPCCWTEGKARLHWHPGGLSLLNSDVAVAHSMVEIPE